MGDMDIGHKEIVIAYNRLFVLLCSSPMYGDKLSYIIIAADDYLGFLAFVPYILRRRAYRGKLVDSAACPNTRPAVYDHMRGYDCPFSYLDILAYNRIRPYLNIFANLCAVVNNSCRVDFGLLIFHEISCKKIYCLFPKIAHSSLLIATTISYQL